MWSSESYKCLGEYSILGAAPLIDFDFDESKVQVISKKSFLLFIFICNHINALSLPFSFIQTL